MEEDNRLQQGPDLERYHPWRRISRCVTKFNCSFRDGAVILSVCGEHSVNDKSTVDTSATQHGQRAFLRKGPRCRGTISIGGLIDYRRATRGAFVRYRNAEYGTEWCFAAFTNFRFPNGNRRCLSSVPLQATNTGLQVRTICTDIARVHAFLPFARTLLP